MLTRSPVIVLGSTKYGDHSIILRTYSLHYGLISFIAGGLGNKKGPLRSSMVQPLTQLELVFYGRSKSNIRRIKEAGISKGYQHILFDPVKNCISLFLAEILTYVLQEEEPNEPLYHFLSENLYKLDQWEGSPANFHVLFLYHLTTLLGFKPEQLRDDMPFFDLMDGTYSISEPPHLHYIGGRELEAWKKLQRTGPDQYEFSMTTAMRKALLQILLDYYRLHIKDFGKLRSLDVLHEVLH